jgi:ubiquinone/menaquinone biosynthesis C-methylase UbiE
MSEQKTKIRRQSDFDFRFMALGYKFRDFLRPRRDLLEEAGIKTCSQVLDYGCGPGSYVMPIIELIGNIGTLYALDVHPLAIKAVQRLASQRKLSNVRVIQSDCATGLLPASIDVVLLYDILHDLENRAEVLAELHRVLKPEGVLSVSDHHLQEDEIISGVTQGGMFKLKSEGNKTLSFAIE